jgi:Tfp pilus assembly protein PilF
MNVAFPRRARPLRLGILLGFISLAGLGRGQEPVSPVGPSPDPGDGDSFLSSTDDTIRESMEKTERDLNAGKVDEALRDVDVALYLHPKSAELLVLRAMIYARKKLWQRADDDCVAAYKLRPDSPIIKYNMAELEFMQGKYDDARPGFLGLQDESTMGDLSAYKVYLCDLLSGEKARAQQELDAFNKVRAKPSYFFANAAWEITRNRGKAAQWLQAVSHAYDSKTIDPYFTALLEADSLDAPRVTFSTRDGANHQVAAFCEDAGLRVFEDQHWITVPYEDLTDDLSGFPADMQRVIIEKKQNLAQPLPDMSQVSFTTRDGRVFDHVHALIEGADLRVQDALGWETIPFSQLPADLSPFPDYWQKEILARDEGFLPPTDDDRPISFATRSGKKFTQVRVFAGRTGLSVVTSDGWETIPFSDLPGDLSAFPGNLRREIVESEKAAQTQPSAPSIATETPSPEPAKISPVWNAGSGRAADFTQQAQDCRFGRCLALEGSRLVVGGDGAAYVYENAGLTARLCPDADQTGTGARVLSVALSGDTIVTSTSKGVYVWIDTAAGWKLQQQIHVDSSATVAIQGDNLAVGVDGRGEDNGPVRFYQRQDGEWQPAKAIDNESAISHSADQSGRRIALQGIEAVIGLPNWDPGSRDSSGPMYAGHAWVQRWDGNVWQPETQLSSRDDSLGANLFGATVAFSEDLIAVGCSNRDNNPQPRSGSVYLFQRGSDGWQPGARLTTPGDPQKGGFGAGALALSGDTLAVAVADADAAVADVRLSSGEDTGKPGTIRDAGTVYLHEDGKWLAPLSAPDPVDNLDRSGSPDKFAASLALDGETLAVGAPGRDHGEGVVYLWRRQGGQWRPAGELKGFHPDFGLTP